MYQGIERRKHSNEHCNLAKRFSYERCDKLACGRSRVHDCLSTSTNCADVRHEDFGMFLKSRVSTLQFLQRVRRERSSFSSTELQPGSELFAVYTEGRDTLVHPLPL